MRFDHFFRAAGWLLFIFGGLCLVYKWPSITASGPWPGSVFFSFWFVVFYSAWRLITLPFRIRPIVAEAISLCLSRPLEVELGLSYCVYSLTVGEVKLFTNSDFLPRGGRLSGGPREGSFEFFYGFRSEYGYGFPLNLSEARAVRLLYHRIAHLQLLQKRRGEMQRVASLLDSTKWTAEDEAGLKEYLTRKAANDPH